MDLAYRARNGAKWARRTAPTIAVESRRYFGLSQRDIVQATDDHGFRDQQRSSRKNCTRMRVSLCAMDNVILLVDDDHETVDALTALFLQHGWVPVRAYSGEEAMAYLSRMIPSVVLCDLAMPGMSGYDVAEAVRIQHPANCPVLIALTGWSDPGVADQALHAGFIQVLTKPIAFDELLAAINVSLLTQPVLTEMPLTVVAPEHPR